MKNRAVNSRIPEELFRRMNLRAAYEDRRPGALIADALQDYLRTHPAPEPVEERKAS